MPLDGEISWETKKKKQGKILNGHVGCDPEPGSLDVIKIQFITLVT